MRKKAFLIIALLLTVFVTIQFVPCRVFLEKYHMGVGYAISEDQVSYLCAIKIYNISLHSDTVTLDISSERDVGLGFLSDAQLQVRKLTVESGEAIIFEDNRIYIPPLSKSSIMIECIGKYGGDGMGVRHSPESIKLIY